MLFFKENLREMLRESRSVKVMTKTQMETKSMLMILLERVLQMKKRRATMITMRIMRRRRGRRPGLKLKLKP
jgi:hypothetical protein